MLTGSKHDGGMTDAHNGRPSDRLANQSVNPDQEPEKKGVPRGPSAPIKTSSSAVSSAGKVIVPLEMSLEQIGAMASQVLFSPSAGSSTSFSFPDPKGSEASPVAKQGGNTKISLPQAVAPSQTFDSPLTKSYFSLPQVIFKYFPIFRSVNLFKNISGPGFRGWKLIRTGYPAKPVRIPVRMGSKKSGFRTRLIRLSGPWPVRIGALVMLLA